MKSDVTCARPAAFLGCVLGLASGCAHAAETSGAPVLEAPRERLSLPEQPPTAARLPPPLARAIARTRRATTLQGSYRLELLAALHLTTPGRVINEGRFFYRAPEQFRMTGAARVYVPMVDQWFDGTATDVVYDFRRMLLNTRNARARHLNQTTILGPALLREENPFVAAARLRGLPFPGYIYDPLWETLDFVRLHPGDNDPSGLASYQGTTDLVDYINVRFAMRGPSMTNLLHYAAVDGVESEPFKESLRLNVAAIARQRYVTVYVDENEWVRGWDFGPAPSLIWMSMRLHSITTADPGNAFDVAPQVIARATDRTAALIAANRREDPFQSPTLLEQVKAMLQQQVATYVEGEGQ